MNAASFLNLFCSFSLVTRVAKSLTVLQTIHLNYFGNPIFL